MIVKKFQLVRVAWYTFQRVQSLLPSLLPFSILYGMITQPCTLFLQNFLTADLILIALPYLPWRFVDLGGVQYSERSVNSPCHVLTTMPGIVRKLLIFATIDGLIIRPHAGLDHDNSVQVDFKSRSIGPYAKKQVDTSKDSPHLESHGIIGECPASSQHLTASSMAGDISAASC